MAAAVVVRKVAVAPLAAAEQAMAVPLGGEAEIRARMAVSVAAVAGGMDGRWGKRHECALVRRSTDEASLCSLPPAPLARF